MRIFCLTHKPNLSLPLGEMSRSDREGWNQLAWLFKFALMQICQFFALSVICFANDSSPKGRAEKPVRIFCLTHKPNLSLPLGEMSRSDREGWYQLTWLFRFALIRAFLFSAQNKREYRFVLSSLVGGGGFEPPKSLTTDLQSAPFGHSGNLPYSLAEIVELVDGLEPPTC